MFAITYLFKIPIIIDLLLYKSPYLWNFFMRLPCKGKLLNIFNKEELWDDVYIYSDDKGENFLLLNDMDVIKSNMFDEYRDKMISVTSLRASTIEDNAFKDCKNLNRATLNNVSCIGNNAFEGCERLEKITITKIDEMGENVFDGCNNLSTFYVYDKEDAIKIYDNLPECVKNRLGSKMGDEERVDICINGREERLNFDNILRKKDIDIINASDSDRSKTEMRAMSQE